MELQQAQNDGDGNIVDDGNVDDKPQGIISELFTQTDWSRPVNAPLCRALLLVLLIPIHQIVTGVIMNGVSTPTDPFHDMPFFAEQAYNENGTILTSGDFRLAHQACMDALCDISRTIQFDCKVDISGRSASVVTPPDLDDDHYDNHAKEEGTARSSAFLPFEKEIPFPQECTDAADLTFGKIYGEAFLLGLWDGTQAEEFNLFHFEYNPNSIKSLGFFQLKPSQCTMSIYADDDFGGIPLVDFKTVVPGQVVPVDMSKYMCYQHLVDDTSTFWNNYQDNFVEYRRSILLKVMMAVSLIYETILFIGRMIAGMFRSLPLAFCIVNMTNNDHRSFWITWKTLVSFYVTVSILQDTGNILLVCFLAGGANGIYGNRQAATEWTFLHVIAFLPDWEVPNGWFEWLLGLVVPLPLKWKIVMAYMIWMSFPRLGRR